MSAWEKAKRERREAYQVARSKGREWVTNADYEGVYEDYKAAYLRRTQ